MATYDPSLTLGEAVKQYFVANNFGKDGGYNDRWVEVKIGPIPFYVLNTQARVRAVGLHDLHHVLTGYETNLLGEGEIAAWELASGCADKTVAWVLNFTALILGLAIDPRRTFFAFIRGRQTQNLYREVHGPALLAQNVGATAARLGLDRKASDLKAATLSDVISFCAFTVVGVPVLLVSIGLGVVLIPVALLQKALGMGKKPVAAVS